MFEGTRLGERLQEGERTQENQIINDNTQVQERSKIEIKGRAHEVNPEANFIETISRYAKEHGFGKFRVQVTTNQVQDMEIINPNNAPQDFNNIQRTKILPYDAVGK